MSYPRSGFTPSREPHVDWIRNFPVKALAKEVAKGDAAILVSGKIAAASGATNPSKQGFGVVLAVYTTANRPLTFQTTKYIASGGVGRADVCFDPNQSYTVQCVTSVGATNIGQNVMIDVSGANSTTGISGMSVDFPASASTNEYFKLINISPLDSNAPLGFTPAGWSYGGANNGVEVRWNLHFLNSPTAAA